MLFRIGPQNQNKIISYVSAKVEIDDDVDVDELTLWGEFHSPERIEPFHINKPYETETHSNFQQLRMAPYNPNDEMSEID